jgi:hypothetical protein
MTTSYPWPPPPWWPFPWLPILALLFLLSACDEDLDADGYAVSAGDCDDGDPDTYPGALDTIDGKDNDCDGFDGVVVGSPTTDDDHDGQTEAAGDCNDNDPLMSSWHDEVCDYIDNNCDGAIDVGTTGQDLKSIFYRDNDRDTYGDPNERLASCAIEPGWVTNSNDCDDTNPAITTCE